MNGVGGCQWRWAGTHIGQLAPAVRVRAKSRRARLVILNGRESAPDRDEVSHGARRFKWPRPGRSESLSRAWAVTMWGCFDGLKPRSRNSRGMIVNDDRCLAYLVARLVTCTCWPVLSHHKAATEPPDRPPQPPTSRAALQLSAESNR